MSFNGIGQFEKNLRKLQASETYQKGDFATRMRLGYSLLKSKYGFGIFGKVKPL